MVYRDFHWTHQHYNPPTYGYPTQNPKMTVTVNAKYGAMSANRGGADGEASAKANYSFVMLFYGHNSQTNVGTAREVVANAQVPTDTLPALEPAPTAGELTSSHSFYLEFRALASAGVETNARIRVPTGANPASASSGTMEATVLNIVAGGD
jgi:hypothetical protein